MAPENRSHTFGWETVAGFCGGPNSAISVEDLPISSTQNSYMESDVSERLLQQNGSKEEVTPFASATFISRMCFLWLNPLLSLGYKKPLEAANIPGLAPEDEAERAYIEFTRAWNEQRSKKGPQNASLFWSLASCYWKDMLCSGLYALVKSVTLSAGPLVLNAFVKFAKGEVLFKYEGYVLVAVLFLVKIIESVSQRQWYFGNRRVGMHARSALIGAIYQKELKLSNLGRQSHAAGEVVNYMAVDAYRVGEFPYWLHFLWTTPLQIIIALAILFFCVGWATLAGVFVIIITMFLNGPVVRAQQKYQSKLMAAQDERLRTTVEVLRNMKILKMQAWEDKFRATIENLRETETIWLKGVQYRATLNSIFFWVSPILVTTSTFVTCYFLRIPLTASNVFTALATLRIIQEPIRLIPDVIAALVNVRVSLARISRFLCEDELDPSTVKTCNYWQTDSAVDIEEGNFDWDSDGLVPTLRNINMTVKHGEKVAVCGEVGSGKSTLLHAILGEIPMKHGRINVSGSIAYVAQSAWIQSGTIRDNVLFGFPMDKERYVKTLKACALDKDLDNLPFGDLTEIGERGLNVSGGQKQRIQLARAIYQDADVYLLDDPFSAVDAQTARLLIKNCILGALSKKTIILVTHQVDYLPIFDVILLMQNGEVCQAGKFEELFRESDTFKELVTAHKEVMGIQNDDLGNRMLEKRLSSKKSQQDKGYVADTMAENQLTQQEEIEHGDTGLKPYFQYLSQANGLMYFGLALLAYIVFMGGQLSSSWWMASEVGNPDITPARLIGIYAAIGLSTVPFVMLRSRLSVIMGIQASKSFFTGLMLSLFQAPILFFESTPTGRILSRLSVDLSILDLDIPFSFQVAACSTLNAYSSLAVTAAVTWQILIVVIPVIYMSMCLQFAALLFDISQRANENPWHNKVTSSQLLSRDHSSYAANEWLIQRVETLWSSIVCCSALVMVLLPAGQIDPGFVGLAISYGLSLNVSQVISIQNQCSLANFIISVERIKQYMHIPCEEPARDGVVKPPASWPSVGRIELQNLQIRYAPEAPLVLRGITCTFGGGQRVGIVGRTGSGKTTLISALFRLVEPAGGKILIDGIDIASIALKELRSRLSIIPQEPTLFRGTVRFNVDPLEQHSDSEIWEVLGKCQLGESIREKPGQLSSSVGDEGENWSVGQRQLFCLARALLKRSRILVLDEATASIDNTTDAILQKLLKEEFSGCTVITVAHRIPTVIDSDMVLALNDGGLVEFDAPGRLLEKKTSVFGKLVAEYWSNSQQAR